MVLGGVSAHILYNSFLTMSLVSDLEGVLSSEFSIPSPIYLEGLM